MYDIFVKFIETQYQVSDYRLISISWLYLNADDNSVHEKLFMQTS